MKTVLRRGIVAATVILGGGVFAGCGSSDSQGTVFAAASLSAAFEEIDGDAGSAMSFGGSSGLVDQLAGGASADVFASADTANMDRAVEEGLIAGDPVKFATNGLILVTPPDNPAGVTGLDGSLAGAKLVICAPEVPCGRASQELAADLGLELQAVSEELSVTDVLGKATSGEADVGLVYTTDATAAGEKVHQIEIPAASAHLNDYWIALVAGGDREAGQAFIDQVMGPNGQRILAEYGFGAP